MKKKILVMVILIMCFCLISCGNNTNITSNSLNTNLNQKETKKNEKEQKVVKQEKNIETIPTEPIIENYSLSMIAVGDNLIHSPIYKKAKQSDGSYDFSSMYANIKDTIQSYDLAIINQETIYVNDESNVSSYPCFGTPSSIGDTLVDIGFDVILSATNHTWDKRSIGFDNTIEFWKKYPNITLLGIHENEDDFNTIDIIEKNGFKLGMFNYTYGLNGFTLPIGEEYKIDLLDNKDKFIEDIKSIENDVDFTICFLHIGTEYTYTPTTYQVDYINDLIDVGADIIICTHPHVVEPYDIITTPNGNVGLVYYSCGNFISNQDEIDRVLGGMAEIYLTKTIVDGEVTNCSIKKYDFEPIVTHYNSKEHTIYKLSDYTNELANTHSLKSKNSKFSVEYLQDLWNKIINLKL